MEKQIGVSVIIPTLADAARAELLERAIESVLVQQTVSALPVVAVNGDRFDPIVLQRLNKRRDTRCIFVNGGLPEARLAGRDAVNTPFFAFLDDDDELLPHSLELRLQPMIADNTVDMVVSNGLRVSANGAATVTDPGIVRFQRDPLRGLCEGNWLNENGGLFRTGSIGREFFVNLPPVVEWTYIAFQLAQRRNIRFMDVQTFVKHDTPQSLSKSKQYLLQHPSVLLMILRLPLPDDVRARMKRKYLSVLHNTSAAFLEMGEFGAAWSFHLKSLTNVGGWRYLPYTRHILWKHLIRINSSPGVAAPDNN